MSETQIVLAPILRQLAALNARLTAVEDNLVTLEARVVIATGSVPDRWSGDSAPVVVTPEPAREA